MSLDIWLDTEKLCPYCGKVIGGDIEVYSANITHNMGAMAAAVGIYDCLWRAQENGITKAEQLIEPLARGIETLKGDPAAYERYNPENGWGSYDAFVVWLENLLENCKRYPNSIIGVSR